MTRVMVVGDRKYGDELYELLQSLMSIPEGVKRFSLNLSVHEPVTAECEFYPSPNPAGFEAFKSSKVIQEKIRRLIEEISTLNFVLSAEDGDTEILSRKSEVIAELKRIRQVTLI